MVIASTNTAATSKTYRRSEIWSKNNNQMYEAYIFQNTIVAGFLEFARQKIIFG